MIRELYRTNNAKAAEWLWAAVLDPNPSVWRIVVSEHGRLGGLVRGRGLTAVRALPSESGFRAAADALAFAPDGTLWTRPNPPPRTGWARHDRPCRAVALASTLHAMAARVAEFHDTPTTTTAKECP